MLLSGDVQKTSYANVGHGYGRIPTRKHLSSFIDSMTGSRPVWLFLHFRLGVFSSVRPLVVLIDVPELKYIRFTYMFWHWAQEWDFWCCHSDVPGGDVHLIHLLKNAVFGDLHLHPLLYPGSDNMDHIFSWGCKPMNILGVNESREDSEIENLLS